MFAGDAPFRYGVYKSFADCRTVLYRKLADECLEMAFGTEFCDDGDLDSHEIGLPLFFENVGGRYVVALAWDVFDLPYVMQQIGGAGQDCGNFAE